MCPECYTRGTPVKNETVRSLVKAQLAESLGRGDFLICMNETCPVVYYKPGRTIYTRDMSVPVWFKAGANPKYICYCNKVTEQQIRDAILEHNARNMQDIIRLTGAMKNGKCLQNNPTGKCCGPVIQDIIDKYLKH